MRLLLMRHGQTHANVSGELDTAHPGLELTDLGHTQATAAAQALLDEHLDAIYVSSRTRTHQTAAPTARARSRSNDRSSGAATRLGGSATTRSRAASSYRSSTSIAVSLVLR